MTALDTVLELAEEAIEKREAHEANCAHQRTALKRVRDSVASEFRTRGPRRDTLDILESQVEQVDADPTIEHEVAVYATNEAAYKHRVKWTVRGYEARTSKRANDAYAVLVKGHPS